MREGQESTTSTVAGFAATLLFAAVAALGLAGCEDQGPFEEAGENVDEAAEETGEAAEDAADEAEDAFD